MTVHFLDDARRDLRDAVRYHQTQKPGLGKELRVEVRAAISRIEALPEAWHSLGEATRCCRTQRFPYGVIHQATATEILVIAVSHLHRRPEHWKDRV